MRAKAQSLLAISLVGLGCRVLSGQANNPDESLRYRLIQVVETTVLVDKVNEAAKDGYRLAGVAPASGGTTVAVLEKTADPQNAYSYLLLGGKGDPALAQSLNEAAAKGYRLVSRNVALDWRPPVPLQLRTVVAWMEKPPGPPKKYEYAVIPFGTKMSLKAGLNPKLWADFNPLDYVKREIESAEGRGFRLARIVSGVALVMEKANGSGGEEAELPKSSSGSKEPPAYRSLSSLRGAKLERKLQEEAAGGYCVVDMDPQAPVIWPSILLDKNRARSADGAPQPCAYEVIQKRNLGEDDFNHTGDRGFRLVPQSLNYYGAYETAARHRERGEPEINAIFEKPGSTNEQYHYRSYSAPELSDLSVKLEEAGAEGYHTIKVDSVRDVAVLVIMEKSEAPNRK